jgi:hypothetical protein
VEDKDEQYYQSGPFSAGGLWSEGNLRPIPDEPDDIGSRFRPYLVMKRDGIYNLIY